MINAIANISLNQIERASTDEFERDILTKASAITLTPITFLELIVAAILAWSLPGRLSLLALLAIVPSIAGTSLSAAWMRRHIATPTGRSNWTLTALYLIPMFLCFAGIAYHAYALSDAAAPLPHRRHRRCHHVRPHLARTPTEAKPPRPVPPRRRARGLMLTPPPTRTPPPALRAHRGRRVVSVCYAP